MTDSTTQTASTRQADPAPEHPTCPTCSAPVADDQRYCLSCGARLPNTQIWLAPPAAGSASAQTSGSQAAGEPPPRDWTPAITLGGLVTLALVLVIGVLIGRSSQTSQTKPSPPQVITVGSPGTGTTPSAPGLGTAVPISEDWPAGENAWTVELQNVAKVGATAESVQAAKSAATGRGAVSVGVLDGANHNSLGQDYIIYSGIYSSRAQALSALGKLRSRFPSATAIHVVSAGGTSGAANTGLPPSHAQQAGAAAAIQALNNARARHARGRAR